MMDSAFQVKIISRDGIIFEGQVKSLTSYNDHGKFDILEAHANFISLIYQEIELVKLDGTRQTIKIEKALLKNKQNTVEIFVGIDNITN